MTAKRRRGLTVSISAGAVLVAAVARPRVLVRERRRRRTVLGLAERRPVQHAVECGVGDHDEVGRAAPRRLAVPRARKRWGLRPPLVDAAHAGRRRLRAGHLLERLRHRPSDRSQAVGAPQAGAERRSQRPRARRRPALRAPATLGVRARRLRRPPALEHAAREPDGAVRQHHAASSIAAASTRAPSGFRPVAAERSTRSTRQRESSSGGSTRSRSPGGTRSAGGGGAWEPLSVDASGRVYAGIANPAPWGGSRRLPERRLVPRPDALHRLARRPRRRAAAISSGTTRCFRTTSGTTTSSSRPSSRRWRDATS